MRMRQYVLTVCVLEQEQGPALAAATAMISDNESGGSALPAYGKTAFTAMAAILAELIEGIEAQKIELHNGITNGTSVDKVRAAQLAEQIGALAGAPPFVRVFPEGESWYWERLGRHGRHGPFGSAVEAGGDARAAIVRESSGAGDSVRPS